MQDQQTKEGLRAYVRGVMQDFGMTSTELARAAGLAPSTLNRFLNSDVDHMLSYRTLAAIRNVAARRS